MSLRRTTLPENARSALECGPAMRDRLEIRAKSPSADGYRSPRCSRHSHSHGSDGQLTTDDGHHFAISVSN